MVDLGQLLNAMVVDDLAPCITRSSAAMVLTIKDINSTQIKKCLFVICKNIL